VDPRIGTEIAGYRLESLLARGGMGEVYLATQAFPERKVALKLLPHELAADASFRARFIRESNAAASLEHPNIVPVYGAGEADGELYIAMRYVEGTDLRRLLQEDGPLSPERAVGICAQVADALDEAHEHGLVHRDVKPGNILLSKGDRAYLSDFGLIRRSEAETGITKTGEFMGTVDYVAPEQIKGEEVDGRADTYSLGCVLYECLTGEPPFVRETEVATLYAHLQDPPPKVSQAHPELPPDLDRVIAKAMAKRPEDRYATATELAEAAVEAVAPVPALPEKRRRAPLVGALAAAVVLGVVLAIALTAGGGRDSKLTPAAEPTLAPNQVIQLDPVTGKVLEQVSPIRPEQSAVFGGTASGIVSIAVGEGGVWAVTSRGVAHIDPDTGEVEEVVIHGTNDVAVGGRAVWATAGYHLFRIDPATDVVRRVLEGWAMVAVAVGDRSLWIAQDYGNLWRVDMATSEVLAKLEVGGADGVAFGSGSAWVLDNLAGEVVRIDPGRNEVVDRIAVAGNLSEVAASDQGVWVLDADTGTVTRIDPADLSAVDTYRVGNDPADIQVALGAVWVANRGDGTLSRIDPALGTVETIEVGGPVAAIAGDEATGTLWLQLAEKPCMADCG
jgi:streptogramin lyase